MEINHPNRASALPQAPKRSRALRHLISGLCVSTCYLSPLSLTTLSATSIATLGVSLSVTLSAQEAEAKPKKRTNKRA